MQPAYEALKTLASFFAGAVILCFLSYTQKTVVGYPHIVLGYAIPSMTGGLLGSTIYLLYKRVAHLNKNQPGKKSSPPSYQVFTATQCTYSLLVGSASLCLFSAIQKALAGYPMKLSGFTVPLIFGGISGALIGLYLARSRRLLVEQQQAVSFWQQEQDRTSDILTSIGDGLLVTNSEGRIELVNPAAEQLLEFPASALKGQTLAAVMSQATSEDHSKFFTPSQTGNSSLFKITTADGSLRTVKGRTAAVHNGKVCTGEIILLLHDNTEEQRIDRIKSEFISTATHNLKTPITAIAGYSELLLLQDNLNKTDQKEFLTYIHDKSWHLNKLIDNLLDVSRAESGREIRLEKENIEAQSVFDTTKEFCNAQQSRCDFRFQLKDCDSQLYIDQSKIEQVMENLISNAIKFSPQGGLVCIAGQQQGSHYEITVSDEGIGMSDEECAHIFDKFYRTDASADAPEGIGLGLTLVKKLIDAHGGEIKVKSSPHQGTTISFNLPIRGTELNAV